jgi:hypothetical protein
VAVAGGGAKGWAVLQLADDAVEAAIRLKGHMLRVFIANGAELAAQFGLGNARTTQATYGISVRSHM